LADYKTTNLGQIIIVCLTFKAYLRGHFFQFESSVMNLVIQTYKKNLKTTKTSNKWFTDGYEMLRYEK